MYQNIFEGYMFYINAERYKKGWGKLEESNRHVKLVHPERPVILHFSIQDEWTKHINQEKDLPFDVCIISLGHNIEDLHFCVTPNKERFLVSRVEISNSIDKMTCTKHIVKYPGVYEDAEKFEDIEQITLIETAFLSLLTNTPTFRLRYVTGALEILKG